MNRIFFFLLAIATFFGCQKIGENQISKTEKIEIPALLDRAEAVQNGKEWDNIQNIYAACKAEILAKPEALEPRLKLAELFIQEARVTGEHPHYYPAALAVLNQILAKKPENKDILFRALASKASVELSLHNFSTALETAQKAIEINPHNAQIYGALVDANVELGHYKQAVEAADKMVSIRPDLRSYSRVSYLREIHGDPKGAIEAMKMAVAAGGPAQESTAWARLTLSNLLKNYGSKSEAEMQLKMLLAERPDYPFAEAAMAELFFDKKDFATAEKWVEKACAGIPEVSFFETKMKIYQATNRQKEAAELGQKILEMMNEDMAAGHDMSLELANFYAEMQPNLEKAVEFGQKELAARPENIDVNRAMAKIFALKKDKTKATEHLRKAKATGSKHPELKEIESMI